MALKVSLAVPLVLIALAGAACAHSGDPPDTAGAGSSGDGAAGLTYAAITVAPAIERYPSIAVAGDETARLFVVTQPGPEESYRASLRVLSTDLREVARSDESDLQFTDPSGLGLEVRTALIVHEDGSATAALSNQELALYLFHYDAEGAFAWKKTYRNNGITGYAIAAGPDGSFYLAVSSPVLNFGGPTLVGEDHPLFVVTFDRAGEVVRRVHVVDGTMSERRFLRDIRVATDGSLWLLTDGTEGPSVSTIHLTREATVSEDCWFGQGELAGDVGLSLAIGSDDRPMALGRFSEYSVTDNFGRPITDDPWYVKPLRGRSTPLNLFASPCGPSSPPAPSPLNGESAGIGFAVETLGSMQPLADGKLVVAGTVRGRGVSDLPSISRRDVALAITDGAAGALASVRSGSFPSSRGGAPTSIAVSKKGAIWIAGLFGGRMNIGNRTLSSGVGENAMFAARFSSASAVDLAVEDAKNAPQVSCRITSPECEACIRQKIYAGARSCLDGADLDCASQRRTALACACDAQLTNEGTGDPDAYAACFDVLTIGAGPTVARGYRQVCAAACQ